jgi:cytosine/adenosine deaminase-related metal-dependent hydrolase
MPAELIAALAGRRVDAVGAPARFPLENVARVRDKLGKLFTTSGVVAVVASGACGADLAALDAARALGLRRRIVLPFDAATFRGTSVVDRPGDWGPLFDDLVADARRTGDLVELGLAPSDDSTYLRANEAILDEALALAGDPARAAAVIVWEGQPRGPGDITHAFAESARARSLPVLEALTR